MTMQWLATVLTLLLLVLGVGCAPSSPSSAPASVPAAGSAPTSAPPVKVRSAYTAISGIMGPVWTAYEAGLFAREGLDVELLSLPSANEGVQALMANEVDFIEVTGSAVSAALGGGDTLVLTTSVRTIIAVLMARPEIARPGDLAGKGVGVTRRGTSIDTGARLALRHFGLEPDQDVAIVQAGTMPNILGALESNRVQAGAVSYPTATQARKLGYRELLDIGSLGVPYAFTGASTRRSYAQQNPAVVRSYLRAQIAAIHRLRQDKPFALEVFRKYLQTDDADVLEDTYEVYVTKYIQPVPYPDEQGIQGILDELAVENPRAREASPRDFYDDRYVRELDESGYIRSLAR
jgi:NitT/TauT family transport system substrate-binding protein